MPSRRDSLGIGQLLIHGYPRHHTEDTYDLTIGPILVSFALCLFDSLLKAGVCVIRLHASPTRFRTLDICVLWLRHFLTPSPQPLMLVQTHATCQVSVTVRSSPQ